MTSSSLLPLQAVAYWTYILPVTAIPISMLWRARIDGRRKLGLAAVFCVTLITMVVAAMRAGLTNSSLNQLDAGSLFMWTHVESFAGKYCLPDWGKTQPLTPDLQLLSWPRWARSVAFSTVRPLQNLLLPIPTSMLPKLWPLGVGGRSCELSLTCSPLLPLVRLLGRGLKTILCKGL